MTDTINGHLTKDVSTFYTNAEGILTLPEKLPLGKYRIVEVELARTVSATARTSGRKSFFPRISASA